MVRQSLADYTTVDMQAALRPLASLITKSEKAQQKLAPGTWQHSLVQDNLRALRIALALLVNETKGADAFTQGALKEALQALASMMDKSRKAQAKFLPGTSQYTLLENRLKALSIAEAIVTLAFNRADA